MVELYQIVWFFFYDLMSWYGNIGGLPLYQIYKLILILHVFKILHKRMLFEISLAQVLIVSKNEHRTDGACELASSYHIHRVERGQSV